ncbi:MAG: diaminopimelate epimerase [Chitinophagaceae bacterium]|nr:diaminopimelate epimerase [Chitinophagaceae bacterium]
MTYQFYKYQGTGNDFIILDNRQKNIVLTEQQVNFLCDRKFGIGADGLMLLQEKVGYDFEMVYYNSDGKLGSMCGNGSRCLTQFAYDRGIKKDHYTFIASDGDHESKFSNNGWVRVKMIDVNEIQQHQEDFVLNTGSPHYIKIVKNLDDFDVYTEGKKVRYSEPFHKNGINVNFIEHLEVGTIKVRTYERGVENETLSCGTGVTASAIVCFINKSGFNNIQVQTLGGRLAVEYNKTGISTFDNIWLCGPATFVFSGEIHL